MEMIDKVESLSSDLELWMSDAVQKLDTVSSSLETVPPNADKLANAAVVLEVCCLALAVYVVFG